jgi:hypothetical protein
MDQDNSVNLPGKLDAPGGVLTSGTVWSAYNYFQNEMKNINRGITRCEVTVSGSAATSWLSVSREL